MCCLPSLTAIARGGRPTVDVQVDPMELLQFVANDFGPMNEMCERALLSERAIYDRTKAVMEYFGFPFDAPPPEQSLLGAIHLARSDECFAECLIGKIASQPSGYHFGH